MNPGKSPVDSSLARQMAQNVTKKVTMAAFVILIVGILLHLFWSGYQKVVSEKQIRDAVAFTLQEHIKQSDWISIRRTLHAFSMANEHAEICVKLPGNVLLSQPACNTPVFQAYNLPLTSKEFFVSVRLPLIDKMFLAGVPFLFACLILVWFVSRYLKGVSIKVASDLNSLLDDDFDRHLNFSEIEVARSKIKEGIQLRAQQSQMEAEAAIGAMTAQVAHDIRSPLAALSAVADDLEGVTDEQQRLFSAAVSRIKGIADGLLVKPTEKKSFQESTLSAQSVSEILDLIVSEKKMEFRKHRDLSIDLSENKKDYFVKMEPDVFRRVLSNLINNSCEALKENGQIIISVQLVECDVLISVEDNGPGFAEATLPKLGLKGSTFQKANGHGLGLYYARSVIESWGGRAKFINRPEGGARVTLTLPLRPGPTARKPSSRLGK